MMAPVALDSEELEFRKGCKRCSWAELRGGMRCSQRQLVHPLWQRPPIKAIELVGDCCHALHYY